jgi:hypothetical protein
MSDRRLVSTVSTVPPGRRACSPTPPSSAPGASTTPTDSIFFSAILIGNDRHRAVLLACERRRKLFLTKIFQPIRQTRSLQVRKS